MPHGKPAGEACVHLDAQMRCRLFGQQERPGFCAGLAPGPDLCGQDRAQAMILIAALEDATRPIGKDPAAPPVAAALLTRPSARPQ